MPFHYCGNPIHDFLANALALIAVLPEWMPYVRAARTRASRGR